MGDDLFEGQSTIDTDFPSASFAGEVSVGGGGVVWDTNSAAALLLISGLVAVIFIRANFRNA